LRFCRREMVRLPPSIGFETGGWACCGARLQDWQAGPGTRCKSGLQRLRFTAESPVSL
jgi:hypothetical protein